jgi:hypothetical protein
MPSKRAFGECEESDDGGVVIRSRRARQPQPALRADNTPAPHTSLPQPEQQDSACIPSPGQSMHAVSDRHETDTQTATEISRPGCVDSRTPRTAQSINSEPQIPVMPKKREASVKDLAVDVWAFFQTRREVGTDPHIRCKICLCVIYINLKIYLFCLLCTGRRRKMGPKFPQAGLIQGQPPIMDCVAILRSTMQKNMSTSARQMVGKSK